MASQEKWDSIANDQQKLWIAEMRSGKYPQTTGKLRRLVDGGTIARETPAGFCCLGIGCQVLLGDPWDYLVKEEDWHSKERQELCGHAWWGDSAATLPDEVVELLCLRDDVGTFEDYVHSDGQSHIAALNDSGYDFNYIADFVIEHAEQLFTNFGARKMG